MGKLPMKLKIGINYPKSIYNAARILITKKNFKQKEAIF